MKSEKRVIEQHIDWLKKAQHKVLILGSSTIRLDGLKALAVQIQYVDSKTSEVMKQDFICALTKTREEDEFGIIYTMELTAPDVVYLQSRKILKQILKTWAFL